jgi:hypothetical protein
LGHEEVEVGSIVDANKERQLRLGHVEEEKPKSKSKAKSKAKEESEESEA